MAEKQNVGATWWGSLFWPAMVALAAAMAAGIFGYVFAEVYGAGWRAGAGLGALVFVASGWILASNSGPSLPPPNTVKIDVPPAPTAPRSSSGPSSTPAPSGGGETAPASGNGGTPSASTPPPSNTAANGTSAGAAAEAARMAAGGMEPQGSKPATLEAPRDGQADDFKKIKGIGPKIEEMLHRLGYFHYDQVASWGPQEVAWVDTHLEGFNGRATRDDWVGQAKLLAGGGATEFSERVDKGEVYNGGT